MKTLVFDKVVSLLIDKQEKEIQVAVNGVKFIWTGKHLAEKWSTLTVKQAKEIEAKYEQIIDEDGNKSYSPEDIEKIQEEAASYDTLEEVVLYIDKENIIPMIEKALTYTN